MYAHTYVGLLTDISDHTRTNYIRSIDNHLIPWFGELSVSDRGPRFLRAHISQWILDLQVGKPGPLHPAGTTRRPYAANMLFCEIKTHDTELLPKTPYRVGVYQASKELGGGVAQVQKTASKAQQLISSELLTRARRHFRSPWLNVIGGRGASRLHGNLARASRPGARRYGV
ncbi:hypothetical protein ACFWXA_02845 [Streptomyces atroolivaceus]|uniref:hypothetical protein n=1 Tax=Streptomyces atroolivaceus TaxID=66869 RepID=UPI00364ADEF9